MVSYEVKVDGKKVWEGQTRKYEGTQVFPAEYRTQRPESGTVQLIVNGNVIANMVSQADEDAAAADADGGTK